MYRVGDGDVRMFLRCGGNNDCAARVGLGVYIDRRMVYASWTDATIYDDYDSLQRELDHVCDYLSIVRNSFNFEMLKNIKKRAEKYRINIFEEV